MRISSGKLRHHAVPQMTSIARMDRAEMGSPHRRLTFPQMSAVEAAQARLAAKAFAGCGLPRLHVRIPCVVKCVSDPSHLPDLARSCKTSGAFQAFGTCSRLIHRLCAAGNEPISLSTGDDGKNAVTAIASFGEVGSSSLGCEDWNFRGDQRRDWRVFSRLVLRSQPHQHSLEGLAPQLTALAVKDVP